MILMLTSFVVTLVFFLNYSRNLVHSLVFLILVYLGSSIVCILLDSEFIAFSLIIIYVGGVSVFILFSAMLYLLGGQFYSHRIKLPVKFGYIVIIFFIFLSLLNNFQNEFILYSYPFSSKLDFIFEFYLLTMERSLVGPLFIISNCLFLNYSVVTILVGFHLLVLLVVVIVISKNHNKSFF